MRGHFHLSDSDTIKNVIDRAALAPNKV